MSRSRTRITIASGILALTMAGCGMMPASLTNRTSSSLQARQIDTPSWVQDAVFYQIFPERFANGNPGNDPKDSRPWGSKPEYFNFMGGDLEGALARLGYIRSLGVNAIYLNPIFTSSSNHKYNTSNYFEVDPHFGGDAAFDRFLKAAHGMGMKVILDGVFNHTSDEHPFFQDCIKKGPASPYWSWYTIYSYPVVTSPRPNYNSWWGFGTLPQWRAAADRRVQDYIFSVEEHWLKKGIDGWRLDVPNEIDNDDFWREFRTRARKINPQAYIVGEIWEDASRWLKGDQFDSVMNYEWRTSVCNFLGNQQWNVDQFDWALAGLRNKYDARITNAMFNILSSHDVPRFRSVAGGDRRKTMLANTFQMTYPGAPVIYYGDEIGMEGEKDPDNRRCFPTDARDGDGEMLAHTKHLVALRREHPALRSGSFVSTQRHNDMNCYAYQRVQGNDRVTVVLNNADASRTWNPSVGSGVAEGATLVDGLTGKRFTVKDGRVQVHLAPKQGLVLVAATPNSRR